MKIDTNSMLQFLGFSTPKDKLPTLKRVSTAMKTIGEWTGYELLKEHADKFANDIKNLESQSLSKRAVALTVRGTSAFASMASTICRSFGANQTAQTLDNVSENTQDLAKTLNGKLAQQINDGMALMIIGSIGAVVSSVVLSGGSLIPITFAAVSAVGGGLALGGLCRWQTV